MIDPELYAIRAIIQQVKEDLHVMDDFNFSMYQIECKIAGIRRALSLLDRASALDETNFKLMWLWYRKAVP